MSTQEPARPKESVTVACTVVPRHSLSHDPAEHRAWSWGGAALIVIACLAVEAVGGLVASGALRDWAPPFDAPEWASSERAFGRAWPFAHLFLAAAAALVWLARDRDDVCCPLTAFAVQLAASLAWVVLLFGMGRPLMGLLAALTLWGTAGVTAGQFFSVSRVAGLLFAPYWLWVSYGVLLNASIAVRAV